MESLNMGLWKRVFAIYAWSLVAVSAQRVPAASTVYECNRTRIHLVVKMDPWGTGLKLDPQHLLLGRCSPSFENTAQGLFHFQYYFKECGFARLASGTMVEHSSSLVYRPSSSRSGLYSSPFVEQINCTDYEAGPLSPPSQVTTATGQLSASSVLMFTGMLMNEDFSAPSDSRVFFLGSQIHIEFAVQSFFHQPLRVFVDECVAAATPELNQSPRNYSVVANHGCLVDGRVANSHFLPRRAPEVIHLSLQAFEFIGVNADIYLHCHVLVWDPAVLTNPTRKACSFHRDTNKWELLDDPSSSVCTCCDSTCQVAGTRHRRDLGGSSMEANPQQSHVVVGRFTVQKPAQNAGHYEWDSNSSFSVRSHKGKVGSGM
ncbi:zona pellucida sperm-binding protein 3-like isoform X2 [Rhineura floridana]|uniref:zona pellucida sperm-binding protein 3-like isoform X2 n=1 Tax=Rhineura floridana TaxID=261503 RepID=UPI002AC84802|nr:zona pellucida sperm-binding protein 3-like isoform X2 [Rhineura floridana]